MTGNKLLDVREAAPLLTCSAGTLRRLISRGEIGCKRIGKLIRLTPEHIQEYLNRAEVPARAVNTREWGPDDHP
jgi:excisionase family DNA binding protein